MQALPVQPLDPFAHRLQLRRRTTGIVHCEEVYDVSQAFIAVKLVQAILDGGNLHIYLFVEVSQFRYHLLSVADYATDQLFLELNELSFELFH